MLGDQNYHIEYWFRRNDGIIWHVDGDEVYERANPGKIGRVAKASYVVYLEIEYLVGGEFQCLPEVTHDPRRPCRDPNFQPPATAKLITIFPKENLCVRIINAPYHRVLETKSGKRTCLVFSLWSEPPQGYEKHNHWSIGSDGEKCVPKPWPLKE